MKINNASSILITAANQGAIVDQARVAAFALGTKPAGFDGSGDEADPVAESVVSAAMENANQVRVDVAAFVQGLAEGVEFDVYVKAINNGLEADVWVKGDDSVMKSEAPDATAADVQ